MILPALLSAQTVAVRAYTDKNKVLLGEPLWLTLEIKTLNGTEPDRFKVDSIAHFEMLVSDSSQQIQKGDTLVYQQYYQLTSFDSGRWVIPPFQLRPFVKTNSILVDVIFTQDFDPAKPYNDLQPIRDAPFRLSPAIEKWWYPLALLLILLTLLIHLLTRPRKKKAPVRLATAPGAYKKALRELKTLRESGAAPKAFYTQLIDIFKTYILERTGVSSKHQTSNDLADKLTPLFPDKAAYSELTQVLYLADFVKFAKYKPTASESGAAIDIIEKSIGDLEQQLTKPAKNKPDPKPLK
ncbi:BatD family protein [Niabella terrae]